MTYRIFTMVMGTVRGTTHNRRQYVVQELVTTGYNATTGNGECTVEAKSNKEKHLQKSMWKRLTIELKMQKINTFSCVDRELDILIVQYTVVFDYCYTNTLKSHSRCVQTLKI